MSILDWIKILKDLSKSELENLEVFCQERFIKSGEILFKEWDEANSMYLISKWEIEVFNIIDWEEIILGYIEAEEILWEMAIFWEKKKRMANARATKDSVVIILLEFSIQELTKNHLEISNKIKKIIEERKNINKEIL